MRQSRRVFGLHAAEMALEQGAERIVSVWVAAERSDQRLTRITHALTYAGIRWERVSKARLNDLAGGGNHQGIVLECALPSERDEPDLYQAVAAANPPVLVLVLDRVQDPHNLGACLRTGDAAGVMAVVIPKDQSVGCTPTVAKVASGAAETVPVYRVTNLARCLEQLKKCGLWVIGAAGDADMDLYQADLTVSMALVLGAEGRGLRRLTREKCDFTVRIPMMGKVESLNVSVAAGVLLYERLRQRMVQSSSVR